MIDGPASLQPIIGLPADLDRAIATFGVDEPELVRAKLDDIRARAAASDDECARILWASLSLPAPRDVLHRLDRVLEALGNTDRARVLLSTNPISVLRILAGSESLSNSLVRHPELLDVLDQFPEPLNPDTMLEEILTVVSDVGSPDAAGAIRELILLKQRETLRIGWLDFAHDMDVTAVTLALSQLADVLIQGSLAVARRQIEERGIRTPRDSSFAVIALGKLGGAELNYSSDIDLVFVWDSAEGQVHSEDAQAAFDALARSLVHVLSARTDEGHLFRVDLRLRPEGSTGPITRSLSSYARYYSDFGRPWERQMLLKARAIAGHAELGRRFIETVRPFVAGTFLDVRGISEIKRLRLAMERASHGPTIDVKTGSGGIRDIEYSVQFLQLFHGLAGPAGSRGIGRPDVLTANTLEAIRALTRATVLTTEEASFLDRAYRSLRRTENHLQVFADLQTHRLPQDPRRLRAMGRLLGHSGDDPGDELLRSISAVMRDVRDFYQRKLGLLFEGHSAKRQDVLDLLLNPDPRPDEITDVLSPFGFTDCGQAHDLLVRLQRGTSRFLPASPRTREAVLNAAPDLLEEIASSSDADAALKNFERLARGLGSRGLFFRMMSENRPLLSVFVSIAAGSQVLTDLLAREPAILDSFIDALLVEEAGARARRRTLGSLGRRHHDPLVLHDVKALEFLRIGARDLGHNAPIHRTVLDLARLAVALVRAAFDIAWHRAVEAAGEPHASLRMTVIGLGNLGAMELNYASDLDLMFVYDGPDGSAAFCQDVAARLVRIVSESTERGSLYKVDLRLRPEGQHGAIASSFRSLRDYYRSGRAHLFEHQAIIRARPVAGDRSFGSELGEFFANRIRNHTFGEELPGEMLAMRERVETSAPKSDVKRGPGGLVDIEFLIQFLVLRHASDHTDILARKTVRALRLLHSASLLDDGEMDALLAAHEFYRRLENSIQIRSGLDHKHIPDDARERDRLAVQLGFLDTEIACSGQLLESELVQHRMRVREIFQQRLIHMKA